MLSLATYAEKCYAGGHFFRGSTHMWKVTAVNSLQWWDELWQRQDLVTIYLNYTSRDVNSAFLMCTSLPSQPEHFPILSPPRAIFRFGKTKQSKTNAISTQLSFLLEVPFLGREIKRRLKSVAGTAHE